MPFRTNDFVRLGGVAPHALRDTREQLHLLSQLPGAVGNSLVEPESDDTHTTLVVTETGLRSRPSVIGITLELNLVDQRFDLVTPVGAVSRDFNGASLEEHWSWLRGEVRRFTDQPVTARDYDSLPPNAIRFGANVSVDEQAAQELLGWFRNAAAMLETHSRATEIASVVRLWPHHFDVAVLELLDRDSDPEEARSVNIGFSPGDAKLPEPYLYVVPWPAPNARPESPLEHGTWVDNGWFGAVLKSKHVIESDDPELSISTFLSDAHRVSIGLLAPS